LGESIPIRPGRVPAPSNSGNAENPDRFRCTEEDFSLGALLR
jgi:hypothetical protein